MKRMQGTIRAGVIGFALACGLLGCGPSLARIYCLDACEVRNDRCLLASTHPDAIQWCGLQTSACLASCEGR